MRMFAAPLLALTLAVAGCSSLTSSISPAIAVGQDITNSLPLACQSAENILGLAAGFKSPTVVKYGAKLDGFVTKYCNKAIADSGTISTALSVINTTAAVLLGLGVAL